MTDHTAFIRANTTLSSPPLVPEVRLHLADAPFVLWARTQEVLGGEEVPPPFWAFAWVGGQPLARYVLDHPDLVRGKNVFDLGTGSGLTAIVAALAGAATVTASEIDPLALAALPLNLEANGVELNVVAGDVLDQDVPACNVLLAGDVFYQEPMARRVLPFLLRARDSGTDVLVGDPGRPHFPREYFEALASYDIPVPHGIEDRDVKRATVWRLRTAEEP